MNTKHDIGKKGETEAVDYLLTNNYTILERNFRFSRFEIDIIAQDGAILIFVEVKTRNSNIVGEPEDFLSQAQQERIMIAAEHYLEISDFEGDVRFDVIAITKGKDLHHIKDAFH